MSLKQQLYQAITGAGIFGLLAVVFVFIRLWSSRRRVSVRGKVVLITGASSGLGEACAHAFFRAGSKLILCARREEELLRVKNDLIATRGNRKALDPEVLVLDLADLKSIPELAEHAIRFHGHVDILINNGGISYRGDILHTELEVHQRLMQVNYFGQVALTRAILPSMISSGYGHVLTVSSVQGKISIPQRSAYSASKHAIQAFMDCLRAEVAHLNVHVSVVSPGYIRTNLSHNAVTADGSKHGQMDATTASGMKPEDVATRVLHAVRHQEDEIILAPSHHRLIVTLRNVMPALFFFVMRKRAKKEVAQQIKEKEEDILKKVKDA